MQTLFHTTIKKNEEIVHAPLELDATKHNLTFWECWHHQVSTSPHPLKVGWDTPLTEQGVSHLCSVSISEHKFQLETVWMRSMVPAPHPMLHQSR